MAKAATKTAIVTGGAGGVARALIPMLIGDGYRVALIDVNAIGLGKMAAEHGDNVVALPCNLTDLPALTAALEKARTAFGTLDLLINNAGVTTMAPAQPFSKRHGFRGGAKEITVREDAPESLRYFVMQTAIDGGLSPSYQRQVLCKLLRRTPDLSNWSEYPNIFDEVQSLIRGCDWFKVYDFIETLQANFGARYDNSFADAVNEFFVEEGIGWQLVDGQILTRGPEAFETIVTEAASTLETSKRPTAAGHLHEALQGLSRRPKPDLSGAAYHAMGALECVARDLTGDPKATLGEILKRHSGLLPKPLHTALSQVWGYASNEARHVLEGRDISREEAELLVGLSATVSTYLLRKPTP